MLNDDVVIAGFSEEQVERLTGLTKAQLRYWDRTDFFKPSFGFENRRVAFSRIYSFKDIVALRTLSVLRNQHSVSLQHLRQVVQKLRHLEDRLWTETVLYVLNKRVQFYNSETGTVEDILNGQYALGIPLRKIVDDTRRDVEQFRRRSEDQVGRIERSRHLNHNAWVVAGTRIPTSAIRRLHEDGYTTDQIIKEYPDLTEDDVRAALAHEKSISSAA